MRGRPTAQVLMCTLILLSGCGEELTVIVDGAGQVRVSASGEDCTATCVVKVDSGAMVDLTATAKEGSVFSTWMGDCQNTEPSCRVTVDGAKTVIAKMAQLHSLSVAVDEGVKVTSKPEGIDCPPTCRTTFPEESSVALTAEAEAGFRLGDFSGGCNAAPCRVVLKGPAKVNVGSVPIPGTLLFAERIDDAVPGAFAVDPMGQLIWAVEARVETYSGEGKRIRRASVDKAGITSVASVAALDRQAVVLGASEKGAIAAAVSPGGDIGWSIELPGQPGIVKTWAKGAVVATKIKGVVEIGERSLGRRKKTDVLIMWVADGKVTDAISLNAGVDLISSLDVDDRGGAIVVVGGKRWKLHRVAGSEGQRFEVPLGDLESAAARVDGQGRIWVAGSAQAADEELAAVGVKRSPGASCDDGGFGFIALLDPAGKAMRARTWGQHVSAFDVHGDRLTVAVDFVGDVETATGTFTSAGYSALLQDCDDVCAKECEQSADPSACDLCKAGCREEAGRTEQEASCKTEPDVLVGVLNQELSFSWVRHLSAEGDVSVMGVSARKGHSVLASVGERMQILGGLEATSVPSGLSFIRFR